MRNIFWFEKCLLNLMGIFQKLKKLPIAYTFHNGQIFCTNKYGRKKKSNKYRILPKYIYASFESNSTISLKMCQRPTLTFLLANIFNEIIRIKIYNLRDLLYSLWFLEQVKLMLSYQCIFYGDLYPFTKFDVDYLRATIFFS